MTWQVMGLLATFAPMFTVPSFRTFCGLACGKLVIKNTTPYGASISATQYDGVYPQP